MKLTISSMKPVFANLWLLLCLSGTSYAEELTILAEDMPPLQLVQNGKLVGGTAARIVDMAQHICGHAKPIEVVPWARGYKQTLSTPNTAIFSMMRTPSREEAFKWAGPIVQLKFQAFGLKKRQDIQVTQLDDIQKYVAGVIRDDFLHQILVSKSTDSRSESNIYPASDMQLLVKLLYMERIDLIFVAEPFIRHHVTTLNYRFNDVHAKFTFDDAVGGMYLAFNKQTPDSVVECYESAIAAVQ